MTLRSRMFPASLAGDACRLRPKQTLKPAARDLTELPMSPPLNAKARFGLVTIAARTEPPLMDKVRTLMQRILRDSGSNMNS